MLIFIFYVAILLRVIFVNDCTFSHFLLMLKIHFFTFYFLKFNYAIKIINSTLIYAVIIKSL